MFVKPAMRPDAPGEPLRVRFEKGRRLLQAAGEHVEDTSLYWARRLAHGDVVRADPPEQIAEQPEAAAEPHEPALPAQGETP